MYVPAHFRETDDARLWAFIEEHAFATLITHESGEPIVSHVPLLPKRTDQGIVLLGHVARANAHWRAMDGRRPALAIFHGPHAYVSPRFYQSKTLVPTWNYAVVHALGTPVVRDDEGFAYEVVDQLTRRYEEGNPEPWRLDTMPREHVTKLLRAIVPFELHVTRLEGKFKLSQNRSEGDRASVIAALEQTGGAGERAVATMMRTGNETQT